MAEKTYAGKISHSGTQVIKAPITTESKRGKTVKKTGEDLRK